MPTNNESKKMMRPSAAARESALVVVKLGKTTYRVHRALLTESSEYFSKAFTGPWKEAREGALTLEDVECSASNDKKVDQFVDWLYTNKLSEEVDEDGNGEEPQHFGASKVALNALVLGDRILAPKFHRVVRDIIISTMMKYPPCYSTIIYGFAKLPKDHPMLDLMVESHCRLFCTESDAEKEIQHLLPEEFLLRIMLRYGRLKSDMGPSTTRIRCVSHFKSLFPGWNPCDYHGHVSKEERSKCLADSKRQA
ncbi:btb poz domain containing [Pyrenophora seminiperda CCB06]|uniref:Btb poz domain containing n=1 Tax=Pyrenophora seminiperda CCB06 TaxID=1302712 RepID=A0A3M7LVB3_9PLEO|nr:btb poz domain containing [Pyrenophora seminiperda CCB06]